MIVGSTRRKAGDVAALSSRFMARLSTLVASLLIPSTVLFPWSFLGYFSSAVESLQYRLRLNAVFRHLREHCSCVSFGGQSSCVSMLTYVAPVHRSGSISAHVGGRNVQSPSVMHLLAAIDTRSLIHAGSVLPISR